MLIDIIAGARPNFMKIAPIVRALEARAEVGSPLRYRLIHTGQHYDSRLSGAFFEQLGIPEPDVNLEVGSGTQAEQTAAIMTRYEELLLEAPASAVPGCGGCDFDDGLRNFRAEAVHLRCACGGWHPVRRLDDAGGDQSHGHGFDH